MFRNVLVGVDGRPNGRDAIALAARLVDPDGRLSLAHVHSGELHPVHAVTPGLLAEEHDASTAMLERERAAADVEAELVSFVALSPGRGLHQLAEERGADLLVVGSSSRGTFGRAMLGDDTRTALNGAPCAVAMGVRGYAEHPGPLATIGVGYNDTPESESALALARELAAPTHAVIRALEVVSIPSYAFTGLMPPAVGDSIEQMLTAANERLQGILGVEGRAVYGLTGEELAAFGERAGPARRRLAQLRPVAAAGGGQHLGLPRAPRAAARCSCCRADGTRIRPRGGGRRAGRAASRRSATPTAPFRSAPSANFTRMSSENAAADEPAPIAGGPRRRRSASSSPTTTRSCAAACGCCSTARATSRSSPRRATWRARAATCAATTRRCSCST